MGVGRRIRWAGVAGIASRLLPAAGIGGRIIEVPKRLAALLSGIGRRGPVGIGKRHRPVGVGLCRNSTTRPKRRAAQVAEELAQRRLSRADLVVAYFGELVCSSQDVEAVIEARIANVGRGEVQERLKDPRIGVVDIG